MKVLKFGGSSVGSVEGLANIRKIVESTDGRKIVVVSALGGITDLLISTARLAVSDDIKYLDSYARIVERHLDIIKGIVPDPCFRLNPSCLNNLYKPDTFQLL